MMAVRGRSAPPRRAASVTGGAASALQLAALHCTALHCLHTSMQFASRRSKYLFIAAFAAVAGAIAAWAAGRLSPEMCVLVICAQ